MLSLRAQYKRTLIVLSRLQLKLYSLNGIEKRDGCIIFAIANTIPKLPTEWYFYELNY